ncbi:hypothetical protein BDZ89DRAFT_1224211 [Hymenopellis radicata]|nr:hypothetical protein BDZ89DRAFT_1224211 [Hymenopellis radicata]
METTGEPSDILSRIWFTSLATAWSRFCGYTRCSASSAVDAQVYTFLNGAIQKGMLRLHLVFREEQSAAYNVRMKQCLALPGSDSFNVQEGRPAAKDQLGNPRITGLFSGKGLQELRLKLLGRMIHTNVAEERCAGVELAIAVMPDSLLDDEHEQQTKYGLEMRMELLLGMNASRPHPGSGQLFRNQVHFRKYTRSLCGIPGRRRHGDGRGRVRERVPTYGRCIRVPEHKLSRKEGVLVRAMRQGNLLSRDVFFGAAALTEAAQTYIASSRLMTDRKPVNGKGTNKPPDIDENSPLPKASYNTPKDKQIKDRFVKRGLLEIGPRQQVARRPEAVIISNIAAIVDGNHTSTDCLVLAISEGEARVVKLKSRRKTSTLDMDSSYVDSSTEMDVSNVDLSAEMQALQIVEEVYREFNEWSQDDAQASIDSLACKNPDDSFPDRGEFKLGGMDACLIDDEDCIIVNIENNIAPHPPYTSCAPVSRNVLLPEDADLGLRAGRLSHVPYADDPEFKAEQFLRDCMMENPDLKYAWQNDFEDPDVEIMRIEIIKRLYKAEIPLNTLGNLLGKVGHDSGSLWAIFQRDWPKGLDWFGEKDLDILNDIRNNPELPDLKTESVFDAINTCEPAYCLSCERVACGTHLVVKDETTGCRLPVILQKMAKLSAEELHDSDVTPCGDDCFKHLDMDSYEVKSQAESDIDKDQFIIGVLQIDPDILPCDLSFTSKLPCSKIFLYRARFLSQADKRPDSCRTSSGPSHLAEARGPPKLPEQSFSLPVHPCVHDGPCDETVVDCRCYLLGRQCLRSCNCALTCDRRRKGCSCYVEGDAAYPTTALVLSRRKSVIQNYAANAERGLSRVASYWKSLNLISHRNQIAWKSVDTKGPSPGHSRLCNNVDVQRATTKDDLICIRQSKYGSGAFSSSSDVLEANTYLGGELHGISFFKCTLTPQNIMAKSRKSIRPRSWRKSFQKHMHRNYVFELNDEATIDAASMGNVTRFLNDKPARPESEIKSNKKKSKHSKRRDQYANCVAHVIHANEEKHIVLRTEPPVDGRNELTLSYGENYWKTSMHKAAYRRNKAFKIPSFLRPSQQNSQFYNKASWARLLKSVRIVDAQVV